MVSLICYNLKATNIYIFSFIIPVDICLATRGDGDKSLKLWGQYSYTITLKLLFFQKIKTYYLGFF